MPLEGHWERQHTPLMAGSVRERRSVVIVALVLVLATAVILAFALTRSSTASAGCVDIEVPGVMGATQMHACGDSAARLCESPGGRQPERPVRAGRREELRALRLCRVGRALGRRAPQAARARASGCTSASLSGTGRRGQAHVVEPCQQVAADALVLAG